MRRISRLAPLAVALFGLSSSAFADKLKIERIDTAKARAIQVYTTYVDGEGRVVTQKTKDDFKMIVESTDIGPATVSRLFDEAQEPINVIAVVQISPVMQDVIDEARRGVKELVSIVGPKSKIGIYGYAADKKVIFEVGNPSEADAAASNIQIDSEAAAEPHLLDATRAAIEALSNPALKDQRKMIVVFTDGLDVNFERKGYSAMGKKAQEAGIIISTIGFNADPSRLKNLEEFAKQSNGTARVAKKPEEITATFGQITDEIKKQYILTYIIPKDICGDKKDHTFQLVHESKSAYSNTISVKIDKCPFEPGASETPAAPTTTDTPTKSRWWLWVLIGVAAFVLLIGIAAVASRKKPEPMPMPVAAPAPAPAAQKQRTMALNVADLGGGKQPAVGWIVGMTGATADKTFKLKPGRNVMGSAEDCDIKLQDGAVSGHHCEIRTEGGNYKLLDLGSTNGVMVNDKKVREHELVDNDVFRIGKSEFKFKTIS